VSCYNIWISCNFVVTNLRILILDKDQAKKEDGGEEQDSYLLSLL
jgi:hypothetical protein